MVDINIPISKPVLGEEAGTLIGQVLRSGRLAQGPMVARFEDLVADAAGATYAVAVTSGTTALVAALEALDLEEGDEVITSPFTFAATLNAILEAGATARFVDIGEDFNIDPQGLAAAITARTRVLMPVHLYGLAADMDQISHIAHQAGLSIVEDAAQAIGSTIGERRVGSFGLAAFSFYATKNVTTGEGGAVTTDDSELAERIRVLRNQGMKEQYAYVVPGHNYRMTELQAAIGIPQLESLESITSARRYNAEQLIRGLAGIPGLVLPTVPESRSHVYNQFTVRVTSEAPVSRDQVARSLTSAGIGSGLYYPKLVFDYDCYRSHPSVIASAVPNASKVVDEVLSLPVHPSLTTDDIASIVRTVRGALTR